MALLEQHGLFLREPGHAVADEELWHRHVPHTIHADPDIAVIVDEAPLLPAKGDRLRPRNVAAELWLDFVPLWAEGCQ